ncbi:putative cytochrome P450 monooxygenase [Aspergillus saccharolyticus JOP 1030-1]|uniref:Cytochrome P450 n=1 Tax=Aspergillus saccharolyticus JOP 1030-1 TaxID=1450539 RepID=A0A318ZNA8_9EURO|nr:cytochrome P450 [Aspergillus saccharolyticus JOP 1030-1]PYH45913.1 cytochrome P450 [Aspergillus saccharolyticus JOP 1030-1]
MSLAVIVFILAMLVLANASRYYTHLNLFPGPLIARRSSLWHIYLRNSPGYGRRLSTLHAKYGRIVSLGPNRFSVSDPGIISRLYQTQVHSSSSLHGQDLGVPNYDDESHIPTSRRARLCEYEGIMDPPTEELLGAMTRHRTLDLTANLRIFATRFCDRFVFGEKSAVARLRTQATTSRVRSSIIEHLLFRSPILSLKRYRGRQLALCSMMPVQALTTSTGLDKPAPDAINIASSDAILAPDDLTTEIESLIAAFTSVFTFLLRNQSILTNLQDEIDSAFSNGSLSPIPRWREISRLPYLNAVMKESLRLTCAINADKEFHASAVSYDLLPERALPSDTIIVCNSSVAHFNVSIYGDDVHSFRPERWLTADAPRRRQMDQTMLLFHPGLHADSKVRATWLELKKVVVRILLKFDVRALALGQNAEIFPSPLAPSAIVTMAPRMPGILGRQ